MASLSLARKQKVSRDLPPVSSNPLKNRSRPKDGGVPIDGPSVIAINPQEAGPANPDPHADGQPLKNLKRSLPKVELAGPKRDPEFRPNLDERDPEIDPQLETILQEQEGFWLQERAPEMSRQELATQLPELKGTIEALFDNCECHH
uniref:Uncharacterized protein n=1 Tax=Romanomermis culicivorax TaxID=13658 RepID=A0A915JZJ8_ROMCU